MLLDEDMLEKFKIDSENEKNQNQNQRQKLFSFRNVSEQDETKTFASKSSAVDCLENLHNVLKFFDDLPGKSRSTTQKKCHNQFLISCAKVIAENDYYSALSWIEKKFGKNYINPWTVSTLPRRNGKTFMVSQFIAGYMYTQKSGNISVYSVGKEQASSMINEIKEKLRWLGKKRKIITQKKNRYRRKRFFDLFKNRIINKK